ncbi:MAG: homocysteine S-methyltransferase family protein, partial [Clostridiales bacterium]|nr:homocysteine S-methyltransferase family protein [Clostridiales bacterium]
MRRTLLCDGAFGTYYDTLLQGAGTGTATGAGVGIGAGAGEPVELANIRNGALVRRIHAEYIESGAGMIRTNTFGANEPNLRCGRERLREIVA